MPGPTTIARTSPLLWIAAAVLLGCGASPGGGTTVLTLSDYNTKCSAPGDCMAAVVGNVCPCACPSAAINKSDMAKYQQDLAAAQSHCTGPGAGCACIAIKVDCQAGTCTATHL